MLPTGRSETYVQLTPMIRTGVRRTSTERAVAPSSTKWRGCVSPELHSSPYMSGFGEEGESRDNMKKEEEEEEEERKDAER